MPAPIAEVPPPAPLRRVKTPPLTLSLMVGWGLIMAALSVIFNPLSMGELGVSPAWERIIMLVLVALFNLIPLILVWRGFNWARWLLAAILILSYASLLFTAVPLVTLADKVLAWSNAFYDATLLIFLWSAPMRRYFGSGAPQKLLNNRVK